MRHAVANRPPTMRANRRRLRLRSLALADTGQAVLEVAIIAPLLLLLTVGLVEVGKYLYEGIEVSNAAHAGVQFGAQNATTAYNTPGMVNAAKADANEVPSLAATASNYYTCDSAPSVQFSTPAACNASPTDHLITYVQVVASGTFRPFIQYPGLPSSLTISRTAIQQVSP
ncbi:MAG: TadE family protein [Vulcanimicrobiaceae bacterium]